MKALRTDSAGPTTSLWRAAFTLTDLLLVIAAVLLLAALLVPVIGKTRAKTRLAQCISNLQQVNHAVLLYAEDNRKTLPLTNSPAPGGWWYYKEQVKGYVGLTGRSSAKDQMFACPNDRGYAPAGEKPDPFCRNEKYVYTSYVFNGVNLPGVPNIAGREIASIKAPDQTLLVMEWTAHAPLSWHRSRTGSANSPFYDGAESVVAFVDGHVNLTKIYYDGCNAAFTRDPIPGYDYKYSGD